MAIDPARALAERLVGFLASTGRFRAMVIEYCDIQTDEILMKERLNVYNSAACLRTFTGLKISS
jgi:hypothetical protein